MGSSNPSSAIFLRELTSSSFDFPMNHYTHWVGLMLKPNEDEVNSLRKIAEEGLEEPISNGF
jgi:hypothetical protein